MFGVSYHKKFSRNSYQEPGVWALTNSKRISVNGLLTRGGNFSEKYNLQVTMVVDLDAGEIRYEAPLHNNYTYTLKLTGWDQQTPMVPHICINDENCKISISPKRIA
eukprot:TRINITY_DN21784_c0_g1_i3.p1 TRINITY_DN21784_c0_g1~~TRINITY_DN21784_c0_g1_i3.p1  ORF type:complete len:107 (-),score=4.06 TRINITY_DN21784_c0_g1_i3:13-333(-)